jgi:hypothetical protein
MWPERERPADPECCALGGPCQSAVTLFGHTHRSLGDSSHPMRPLKSFYFLVTSYRGEMNDRMTQVLSYVLISGAIVLIALWLTVGRGNGNAGQNSPAPRSFSRSPRHTSGCRENVAVSYSPSLVRRCPVSPVAAVSLEDRRITPSASWS